MCFVLKLLQQSAVYSIVNEYLRISSNAGAKRAFLPRSRNCGRVRVCSGSHRSAATMRREGSAEFRRARVPSFPGDRRV